MKFLFGCLFILVGPFISFGQCPVINAAMVNACATFPSTSEGINEFVFFSTTASATAGSYTLSYGVSSPPANSATVNNLAGSNARTKNGTGTLTSTNGCTINIVTSAATVIPANSSVIFIPSDFDANYDLTSFCSIGTLYVVLIDINAFPSNNWNPLGTFANASGASPRYLQVSNGANNCTSGIRSYNGNGWASNADGNALWWDGSGTTNYQNNGCSTILPPKPTITPAAIAAACQGSSLGNMSFTTTGNPDKYSIDWDNAANAAGFADVTGAALPASPLGLPLPAAAAAATYTGSLTVINSSTPDTSLPVSISVTIKAAPVITQPAAQDTQRVCQNGTVTPFTVSANGNGGTISGYQWYLSLSNSNTTGFAIPGATASTYTASSSNIGTLYFYCKVTNSNGCSDTSNVIGVLIVSGPLATPTATPTQPTCTTPTGTIVVNTPAGAAIKYSIGGAYQLSNTFSGLAPGNYNVTATDTVKGCTSPIKPVVIDAVPSEAVPVASVTTQPDCISTTGTITVTSPLGANYEYSAGGAYQAGTVFSGLTAGTSYNVTVKNITNGCISNALPLSVNAVPAAPPAPTVNITQPDCITTTGSFNITAPLGAAYEYSSGGTYQAGAAFPGLTAGTSYSVTVKELATGCISAVTSVAINVIPVQALPAASVSTQPTCTVPTGIITISSPIGANYQYSVGGAYQAGTSFTGLSSNTYNVTVKNTTTGCISGALPLTVNAAPAPPPAPVTNTPTQPDCISTTGSVSITSPLGANYEYSNGGAYQLSATFSNMAPGPYNITVKDVGTGCISAATGITINAVPVQALPAASVTTQPTCAVPTGTISITSPIGINYQYSAGGAYQAGVSFSSLAPGTVNITVKNLTTGCISAALPLTINAVPTEPLPAASVTTQPGCTIPTGTITITSPIGANYQYSVGGSYQAGTVFTGLAANTVYNVTVQNLSSGCISNALPLTVNAVAGAPASPVVAVTQPDCITTTGSVNITSPLGGLYEYSSGGAYQAATLFNSLTPGNYNFSTKNTSTGCISAPTPVTIDAIPTQGLPVATVTAQPNCTVTTGTITVTAPLGANYQYSVGGNYQAGLAFTGLSASTSYNVTVKNLSTGCISAALPLSVNTVPLPPAAPVISTPSQPDCNTTTSSFNITSPAGANYQYSIGGAYQSNSSFTGLTPGSNYAVTVKDINTGCISPATNAAINNIIPVLPPTAPSPVTYCQNNLASPLTATGANLRWYDSLTDATPSTIAPTPSTATAGNTFYYVTQTQNGCESPKRAITVTINVSSTAVAGFKYVPDTVCLNGINPVPAYDLGFTNGGVFTSSPAGLSLNPANGTINLAGSRAGTYAVQYTYTTTGCISGNSGSYNITLVPAVNTVTVFSYSSPVCKNAGKILPQLATGFTMGGSFSSSNGLAINSSTGEVDPANSTPGQYQVAYRLPALGCRQGTTNFSFINIADTTSPVTRFTYASTDVCLTSGISPAIIKAANFTAGGSFSVSPAGLNVNTSTGAVNVAASVAGVYKIVYAVPALACQLAGKDSIIFILRAYGAPVTNFSYTSPVCKSNDSVIAIKDIAFTPGGKFTANPAGLFIDSITGLVKLAQSNPGIYTVRYDAPQGVCNPPGAGTANLTILPLPAVPAGSDSGICGPGTVNLTAQASGTVSWYSDAALTNLVNTGNNFNSFVSSTTLFYITNTVGTCQSPASIIKAVVSPVPVKPFLGGDTSICVNERLILNAGSYNSYLWQDGSKNSTFTVTQTNTYKVIVSTGVGCTDSASIDVTVLDNCNDIYFPNAFAPQGFNKTFGPTGNFNLISNYTLQIYNRYGEMVFATATPTQRWDGTYKGKPVNIGAYVYVASYLYKNRMNKLQKGTILLIR